MLDYSEPVVSQNVEQSLHLQQRSLIGGPRSGSDIDAVQSGPQSITNKWLTIAKLWWSIIILTAAAFLAFTPTVLAAQETHRPIACIVNCFTWCSSASQISAFCEWVSNPFFFKFRIRKWESRTGARRHKSRRIKQFKLPQTLDGLHGDLRGIRSSCRQLLLPRNHFKLFSEKMNYSTVDFFSSLMGVIELLLTGGNVQTLYHSTLCTPAPFESSSQFTQTDCPACTHCVLLLIVA